MISVSGKKWIEKKINKNTIEKIKQDFNFSEILSKLIKDGDVLGALYVSDPKYDVDIFFGLGGGPGGGLAA